MVVLKQRACWFVIKKIKGMKIIIAGATGFIGTALVNRLANKAEIVIISRDPVKASLQFKELKGLHFVGWDDPVPLVRDTLSNARAIINLSGASIAGKRWTDAYKKEILDSRLNPIKKLVGLIKSAGLNPEVVIQASATGYYPFDNEAAFTESSPAGSSFVAEVTKNWEAAAKAFKEVSPRLVLIRTGIVLHPDGGALPKLALPVKLFAGGPMGTGKQWIPWIHLEDQLNAIIHLLQTPTSKGAYNLTAPNPAIQSDLVKAIAKAMGRPYWLPVPAFAITTMLGQMGNELLLKGNKVLPEKLLAEKFTFKHNTIEEAIDSFYKN
jgi:uncharacterized protein